MIGKFIKYQLKPKLMICYFLMNR